MGDTERTLASFNADLQHLAAKRITIEACENIHLHWRNLRIESSFTDALRHMAMMRLAHERLLEQVRGKVVQLPLVAVCPFNRTHRRSSTGRGWVCGIDNDDLTRQHEEGVDFWKSAMLQGNAPWPIAVRPWYVGGFERPEDVDPENFFQRLDGFKRFMAHAELGLRNIACFVFDEDRRGCQDDMPTLFRREGDGLTEFLRERTFECLGCDVLSGECNERQEAECNVVELLRDGTIHVHIGDLRLEFTREEFIGYASMIQLARASLA